MLASCGETRSPSGRRPPGKFGASSWEVRRSHSQRRAPAPSQPWQIRGERRPAAPVFAKAQDTGAGFQLAPAIFCARLVCSSQHWETEEMRRAAAGARRFCLRRRENTTAGNSPPPENDERPLQSRRQTRTTEKTDRWPPQQKRPSLEITCSCRVVRETDYKYTCMWVL